MRWNLEHVLLEKLSVRNLYLTSSSMFSQQEYLKNQIDTDIT